MRYPIVVFCALATLSAWVSLRPARAFVAAGPMTAAEVDWPSYNNDVASNRYGNLSGISQKNVSGLHVICTAKLGQFARFETGPIEVNGTIYATTADDTFALDAATCGSVWSNAYTPTNKTVGPNRGIAFAQGMVYRGFSDGHVVAMNATTGAIVWNTTIVAATSAEYISAAPIVWNGALIVGTANGDNAELCHVVALDEVTGKKLWSIQTITSAQTWGNAKHLAGGATWTSFSVDPASGKLYVPIGNPGPDFDTRLRKGSDLNTESILELDPATGTLGRGIQLVPEDYHDWDQSAAPSIVTLPKSDGTYLLAAGKDGYLRGINLSTFGVAWSTADTTISNATAPITTSGTHFCPGGAVFWNGPSYSPKTGLAYLNSVDWCKTVVLSATPQPFKAGTAWLGTTDGYGVHDSTSSGWLTAVDATTGAVRWRYHASTPMLSGVTATAGGLVFSADLNGNLMAFDDANGTILQTVSLGAAVGGGIITYELSGKQYVAVASGLSSPFFDTPQTETSIVVLGL